MAEFACLATTMISCLLIPKLSHESYLGSFNVTQWTVALFSPSPHQHSALCRHKLYMLAFKFWILNRINWPSFTVEVSGIATLICIDRLLAKMFRSVICIYHALPIWRARHTLIPFNDDCAAVIFFCLLQLRPAGTIMVFQPGLAMILALRDNFE